MSRHVFPARKVGRLSEPTTKSSRLSEPEYLGGIEHRLGEPVKLRCQVRDLIYGRPGEPTYWASGLDGP